MIPRIDRKKIQREMIENALDFLHTAAAQISSRPKFSILHLATAIEVILKAAIVSEHWSLLVRQNPSASSFSKGDFVSIATKEIFRILSQVIGRPLSTKAEKSFSTLFDHRNQIVHFYNRELANVERVTLEVISSSYYIDKYISDNSELYGEEATNKLNSALNKVRQHNEFLNVKYNDIAPNLEPLKKIPEKLVQCNFCDLLSSEVSAPEEGLSSSKCHVCNNKDHIISIDCPYEDCGLEVRYYASNGFQFLECPATHELSSNDIQNALHDAGVYDTASCGECVELNSVASNDEWHICCECFEVFDFTQLCDWCGEIQVNHSSLEDSNWAGCAFCTGRSGWN